MPLDGIFTEKEVQPITLDSFYKQDKPFLIISYGAGRDSTALCVLLHNLGIRPDLIVFSNLGSEKESTYAYLPIFNAWLRSVGFPEVTVLKAERNRDSSIESHQLRLGIFAALSYGKHSCSVIWKIEIINKFLESYQPVIEARRAGRTICRAVGFEAGEEYRAARSDKEAVQESTGADGCKRTTAFTVSADDGFTTIFPLIEKGIDFDGVLDLIWKAGLPIPGKSSCFFCAAMRPEEISDLARTEPNLFFRALVLERIVQRNKVIPAKRVQGIAFGKKWSDFDFAAPYLDRIEEVIEVFGLDRSKEDADPHPKSITWKAKAARVELFRECFSTAEKLELFMSGKTDLNEIKNQVFQIEEIQKLAQLEQEKQLSLFA